MIDAHLQTSAPSPRPRSAAKPSPSRKIVIRCNDVPSTGPSASSYTHVSSVPTPRPSTLTTALSFARSTFPHLASVPLHALYLERLFGSGATVKVDNEALWADFAFLPSEKGAVYVLGVDEEKASVWVKEEEEDVKPLVKVEEDVEERWGEPPRKRRRGEEARRSEGAPSPEPGVALSPALENASRAAPSSVQERADGKVGIGEKEVFVCMPPGYESLTFCYTDSTTVLDFRRAVQAATGLGLLTSRHFWSVLTGVEGFWADGATLSSRGTIKCLDILKRSGVEEPGLRLFPPYPLSPVRITYRPSRDYPVRVHRPYFYLPTDERLAWTVSAFPDGSFTTGNGELHPQFSVMPAALSLSTEARRWSSIRLNALNSAFSPGHTLSNTIDILLQQFGLSPDTRQDFLKILEDHLVPSQHYLFRFLSHTEYDNILPLEIDPKPDIVSRIFLVFKVMSRSDGLSERYCRGEPVDWPKQIGLDLGKMQDESLFRALEWGLYEVRGD